MKSASEYYDTVALDYHTFYDGDLLDPSQPYPANWFRLQLLKKSLKDCKTVLDVGCGDGFPLSELPAPTKHAFDISPKMVEEARKRLPSVMVADITRPETYHFDTLFDGLICTGVMPHIEDERQALENMKALLSPGGKIFVEFRNELFNLFTFNRLTVDFVADKLTQEKYRKQVRGALSARLNMDAPKLRPYDQMLAKYHNPFEIMELFEDLGFVDLNLLWYHYHPSLPWLGFEREDAMDMEDKPSWKSMFICSAFVVEARRIGG
jgi:SAM-dependent methyltransferase